MKHLGIVAILVISLFFGCRKMRMMERISGKWEFEKFIGYPFSTHLPPGNGRIIILNDDGTYIRKNNDTVVYNGKYSIKRKDDCYPSSNNKLFTADDGHHNDSYVEVKEDQLTFSTPNCFMDGGTSFYRRID